MKTLKYWNNKQKWTYRNFTEIFRDRKREIPILDLENYSHLGWKDHALSEVMFELSWKYIIVLWLLTKQV